MDKQGDTCLSVGEEQDRRLASLRESIRRAFPAEPYHGKITISDDNLGDPDFAAEKELHDALDGRRWTEVPKYLLDRQLDTYAILTDEAFVAFIAAWLLYSLEDADAKTEVREFLAYSFQRLHRFAALNTQQRLAVRSLLAEFEERDPLPDIRNLASETTKVINTRYD